MKTPSILFFASYAAALAVRSNQPTLDPDHPGFVLKSGDEKRAVCNADNLLRNFRDKRYSSSADKFCSLYIQSTITNIFETTATEHQTVTQYSDAPTVTDVTFVVVTVTTGTETVTRQASAVNKRDDSVAYPTWLSASYPASRVSSACSCFIPAPSPAIQTSTTAVLGTETKLITQTLPPTDTTTVTVTSVSTENAVATQIVTVDPPCGLPGCVNGSGHFSTLTQVTVQQCKGACLADSRCQSYQHNPAHSGGYCNLFTNTVSAVRVPSSAEVCSEWRVYERAATCVA